MRNIYIDEAGTSAPEPVSIVAAIIVNPDNDWNMSLGVISQEDKLIITPPPNRVILI